MRIERFLPVDLRLMEVQAEQRLGMELMTPEQAQMVAAAEAYTGWVGDKPVICAGVLPMWEGREIAWAFIADGCSSNFVSIHRAVDRFFRWRRTARIETTVACDFEQGHRWVKLLGFECEAPRMRAWGRDGRDYALYARYASV